MPRRHRQLRDYALPEGQPQKMNKVFTSYRRKRFHFLHKSPKYTPEVPELQMAKISIFGQLYPLRPSSWGIGYKIWKMISSTSSTTLLKPFLSTSTLNYPIIILFPPFIPFSKMIIFLDPFGHFSRPPLYLRPWQKKLSLNFRWGSDGVNGQFEHVFVT